LARIAAAWAVRTLPPGKLWGVFLGDKDVGQIVNRVDIT